ncbi:MAG: methyltransferase domain-containing protein [Nanoarchaeota archaeon]|nr:methyltransferase domain-containing protein [Nanoarchaeota archaeon]
MKKITAKTYDTILKTQDMRFQIDHYFEPKDKFWKDRIKRVLFYVNPQRGEKILDVGCGVGTFAFHVAKRGAHAIGIDYSRESINIAKKIVAKYKLSGKANYIVTNAIKMPFRRNSFNKIVCADFIEHIDIKETKKVVKEMVRVLKKGGLLVLYTPNRNPQLLNVVYQKIKRVLMFKDPRAYNLLTPSPTHIGLKTPAELKQILKDSGLDFTLVLFARDLCLPFYLSTIWKFICQKFFA